MLIVHLFVSYAHVNLCHFFSSSWCQGLAATSACGSSWTFSVYLFEKAEKFNGQFTDVFSKTSRFWIGQSLSWTKLLFLRTE